MKKSVFVSTRYLKKNDFGVLAKVLQLLLTDYLLAKGQRSFVSVATQHSPDSDILKIEIADNKDELDG